MSILRFFTATVPGLVLSSFSIIGSAITSITMNMNALRQRKPPALNNNTILESDIECLSLLPNNNMQADKDREEISKVVNRNEELETLVVSLKQLLHKCRYREKKILVALQNCGGDASSLDLENYYVTESDEQMFNEATTVPSAAFFDKSTFFANMIDRSAWLIGLLIFQSCSSFILSSNESLIQKHPNIIYFLTMLVGAGGNAGNQATVRVIREIAVGSLNEKTRWPYILREFAMAFTLSVILGIFGLVRVSIFSSISRPESIAISFALMTIVLISVIIGALLPLLFQLMHLDPANSSTTIQVIMDISGVLITCLVASLLLDSKIGQAILYRFNIIS